ncbi:MULTISPECIES: helix-turn-helix transcriptional regulator [Exiguobacterium]|uniref:helix-turn-helix domain-containing protein n=1 Tax=Exiguobacterium TaxID=33986 RepID=UPI001BE65930|nr:MULTISPECIES: helix-turn-helix transcriptional regulator [Exiguobacterium]MCT4792852.1 helix-turn-helix domain-containing protein [Exiguobacterium artemiae]
MSTRIHELRLAAGISQRQVAKLTGVSRYLISKLETDQGFAPRFAVDKREIEIFLEEMLEAKRKQIKRYDQKHTTEERE